MVKTVGIIGAGPSGLVAAKCFLRDAPAGAFRVTIFDAQGRIGGLWPVQKDEAGGLVHPLMVANQSKHTVQFSDLAWGPKDPQLPRAWQVGRYLERYRDRYCRDADFHLSSRIEKATPVPAVSDDGAPTNTWHLEVRSSDGDVQNHHFDHLIVASGFFGRPAIPLLRVNETDVPVIHSSSYRDLGSLLGKTNSKGRKILVVGGQMSGVEIAGTIATHLSSETHSPRQSGFPNIQDYSIHHVIQHPVWVVPLYLTPNPSSSAPPFVPVDLSSYNLNNRPSPLTNTQGHITPEVARKFHAAYQTAVGTDQSIFSPDLAIKGLMQDDPPYLAVSDTYLDFVRSGLITVSYGKLDGLSDTTATITPTNQQIPDIAAVVLATGFEAASSLSFLPPSIQQTLSLSPTDQSNPVALAFHGTHHPSVPNLGFVGFYRSPYWGVMEMQARTLQTLWSLDGPPATLRAAMEADTSIQRTLALRSDPRASQFPMGDYLYLMQEFAAALGIERRLPLPPLPPVQGGAGRGMDIVTPARYPSRNLGPEQEEEVRTSLAQTHETLVAGLSGGRFVARAVFRSLLGEWRLERRIVSKLPSHPSGTFSGTARFLLREGTADGRGGMGGEVDLGMEYLYVEDGEFRADNGMAFRARRRYVYRYDEAGDKLSVWFVRTDDQKRADYLFHEVEFVVPPTAVDDVGGKGWQAKSGHLCVDDFYDVKYEFRFEAVNLREWRCAYSVKGPKKDYTIDGTYTR
ncbi:FAD/NAD(P)-binding domain-containing protein [Coniochaeta sp. PMI_546]|nr:FAD/NAD(P)-binding domain-containing protein [Coniochaeta sp. PMI_546]